MKKTFLFIAFLFAAVNSFAQTSTYVSGYTNSNGTYVQGHHRTTPNSTRVDNYSTIGNRNPYTGTIGTKPVHDYRPVTTYSNSQSSTVYTRPRGGTYYINSNGNKTYIK